MRPREQFRTTRKLRPITVQGAMKFARPDIDAKLPLGRRYSAPYHVRANLLGTYRKQGNPRSVSRPAFGPIALLKDGPSSRSSTRLYNGIVGVRTANPSSITTSNPAPATRIVPAYMDTYKTAKVPSVVPKSGPRRPTAVATTQALQETELLGQDGGIHPARPIPPSQRQKAATSISTENNILHSDKNDRSQVRADRFGNEAAQTTGSMIYLDGTSLGRWTVQHLEHALSRAPNGMTGIDPRATAPRGLISPF